MESAPKSCRRRAGRLVVVALAGAGGVQARAADVGVDRDVVDVHHIEGMEELRTQVIRFAHVALLFWL